MEESINERTIKKLEKYLYVKRKEKKFDYLKDITNNFANMSLLEIRTHPFKNSTSCFGKQEMEALNISIKNIHDIDDFFGLSKISIMPKRKFTLNDFAQKAGEYECRRLDLELERVKRNNKRYINGVNEEHINSLVETLFRFSGLYDAKNVELSTPRHELDICGKKYGSNVDRELKIIKTGMIFMIEESKHVSTSSYLKGDVQLACNLIVAHQENLKTSIIRRTRPLETVFAIKVLGTSTFLYFMNYDKNYLEYLQNGKNKTRIIIYKFVFKGKSINITYNSELNFFLNVIHNIGYSIFLSSNISFTSLLLYFYP